LKAISVGQGKIGIKNRKEVTRLAFSTKFTRRKGEVRKHIGRKGMKLTKSLEEGEESTSHTIEMVAEGGGPWA